MSTDSSPRKAGKPNWVKDEIILQMVDLLTNMTNDATKAGDEGDYDRAAAILDRWAGVTAPASPAQSGEEPTDAITLSAQLSKLHAAARGCEFGLVPADGPIARLALFMHEHGDQLVAALSPDTSKVGAVGQTATAGWRFVASMAGQSLKSKWDMQIALRLIAAQADKELRRASPPPAEPARPSRFGKQSEWWGRLTDAHRKAISRNAAYGQEEAFNAGFDAACDAMLSAAPKDMEEGR